MTSPHLAFLPAVTAVSHRIVMIVVATFADPTSTPLFPDSPIERLFLTTLPTLPGLRS